MVRTQLYLPSELYEELKKQAKANGFTFAAFVRMYLQEKIENEKKNDAKDSLTQLAGMFNFEEETLTNEDLDKAIYDL